MPSPFDSPSDLPPNSGSEQSAGRPPEGWAEELRSLWLVLQPRDLTDRVLLCIIAGALGGAAVLAVWPSLSAEIQGWLAARWTNFWMNAEAHIPGAVGGGLVGWLLGKRVATAEKELPPPQR